jgi:hypothetical protein
MSDVHAELDRALRGPYTLPLALDLSREHRYVFLSDQHKGAADRADEFAFCKQAYHAALEHYRGSGFTLVLLGDAEELWEQTFAKVAAAHADSLLLEGSFPAGRYYRIWGNHDDAWMDVRVARRNLELYMPTDAVYEGIRLNLFDDRTQVGTMLCVHGHQGTIGSDKIRGVSRVAVRFWRYVQRLTGIGQTTPSKDACLRGRHDRTMYEWAAMKRGLILLAGHTHRPVWSSKTHLQMLEDKLKQVEEELNGHPGLNEGSAALKSRRLELIESITYRRKQNPPCNDTEKSIPCYFNTGCCKYRSGNITGIEIEGGEIRLVKWLREGGQRELLEAADLRRIFDELRKFGRPT